MIGMLGLYIAGINCIVWLQQEFVALEHFFIWLSYFGDPRNAFLVVFPVCCGINSLLGLQCLWVATFSEWINTVLKWIFQDDRPYWWVHEHAELFGVDMPSLKQFPITCETGPGFPSGHVMSISSIGLLIVVTLLDFLKTSLQLEQQKLKLSKYILYMLFIVISLLVSISRVYISTHFPHQVFIALAVGILITIAVRRTPASSDPNKGKLCLQISAVMLVIGLGLYKSIVSMGYNPSSTVTKAMRWCSDKDWVHLDTTLFYALVRDAGAMFGLGLALLVKQRKVKTINTSDTPAFKLMITLAGVLSMQLLGRFDLPQGNIMLFYCLAFFKFMAVPIIVVLVLPLSLVTVYKKDNSVDMNKHS